MSFLLCLQVSSHGCDRGCDDHPAAGLEERCNGRLSPPDSCLPGPQSTRIHPPSRQKETGKQLSHDTHLKCWKIKATLYNPLQSDVDICVSVSLAGNLYAG